VIAEGIPVVLEGHAPLYHQKVIVVNHLSGISPSGDGRRMLFGMEIQALRRKNLQRYIAKNYPNQKLPEKGNVSAFARAIKKSQPQIADTLRSVKPFREKLARDIENRAGIPQFWLDAEDALIPTLPGAPPPKLREKPADADIADVAAWVRSLDEVGRRRFERYLKGKPSRGASDSKSQKKGPPGTGTNGP
jgi:hypothetical protein